MIFFVFTFPINACSASMDKMEMFMTPPRNRGGGVAYRMVVAPDGRFYGVKNDHLVRRPSGMLHTLLFLSVEMVLGELDLI